MRRMIFLLLLSLLAAPVVAQESTPEGSETFISQNPCYSLSQEGWQLFANILTALESEGLSPGDVPLSDYISYAGECVSEWAAVEASLQTGATGDFSTQLCLYGKKAATESTGVLHGFCNIALQNYAGPLALELMDSYVETAVANGLNYNETFGLSQGLPFVLPKGDAEISPHIVMERSFFDGVLAHHMISWALRLAPVDISDFGRDANGLLVTAEKLISSGPYHIMDGEEYELQSRQGEIHLIRGNLREAIDTLSASLPYTCSVYDIMLLTSAAGSESPTLSSEIVSNCPEPIQAAFALFSNLTSAQGFASKVPAAFAEMSPRQQLIYACLFREAGAAELYECPNLFAHGEYWQVGFLIEGLLDQ